MNPTIKIQNYILASLNALSLLFTATASAQTTTPLPDLTGKTVYYVDAAVSGGTGAGDTWANAFATLQGAVTAAMPDSAILIATGVYYPDVSDTGDSNLATASFLVSDRVSLYGGYPNGGGSLRDPTTYPTILSGDITQDDLNEDGNLIIESADQIAGSNSHMILGSLTPSESLDGNTFSGLTFTGGSAASDGGGAVVFFSGELLFEDCTFIGNQSNHTPSFSTQGGGALLLVFTQTTISRCTFAGNASVEDGGSILAAESILSIKNSTFDGNTAGKRGGAVYLESNTTIFDHSTITTNTSTVSGGGVYAFNGSLEFKGSIVAENTSSTGADIQNEPAFTAAITAPSANLIGDNASVSSTFPAGPLVGTTAAPRLAELLDLGYFGGATLTRPPLFESLALDAATALRGTTDQRGAAGVSDGDIPLDATATSDLGAVELQVAYVDTVIDENDGSTTNDVSLRDAINDPTIDAAVFDPVVFPIDTQTTIILTNGPLIINRSIGIAPTSESAVPVRIEADPGNRVFEITDSNPIVARTVALQFLDIVGGEASIGGNILNEEDLILYRCSVAHGNATDSGTDQARGGGIHSSIGDVTIVDCLFDSNSAVSAGGMGVGIALGGAISKPSGNLISYATHFQNNIVGAEPDTIPYPLGPEPEDGSIQISVSYAAGGAIASESGDILIIASSFVANVAEGTGTGLPPEAGGSPSSTLGGAIFSGAPVYSIGSTFGQNRTEHGLGFIINEEGGAIYTGALVAFDTTIARNISNLGGGVRTGYLYTANSAYTNNFADSSGPDISIIENGLGAGAVVKLGNNFVSDNDSVEFLFPPSPLVGDGSFGTIAATPRRLSADFRTHVMLTVAPLLDGGVLVDDYEHIDQYGANRPIGLAIDIGAFEYAGSQATVVVESISPPMAAAAAVFPPLSINGFNAIPLTVSNLTVEDEPDFDIDTDGDGVKDLDEILTLTSINNPTDYLRIQQIYTDSPATNFFLEWPSKSEVFYTVQSSPDLDFEANGINELEVTGDDTTRTLTGALAGPKEFFRIIAHNEQNASANTTGGFAAKARRLSEILSSIGELLD